MLTTIITSAVVSLVVSLITLYLVQPITGQKQLIGEIDVATRQYSTATPRVAEWRTQGEREAAKVKAEEATQELLRLYPKTARLSKIWAQASCTRASQFSAFFDQRVRRLRRLTNHEIVRSTIHRLAG